MKKVYLAELDTSHFKFRLVGETEKQARANLIKALRKHGRDFELGRDWFYAEDINCNAMPVGVAFRDYTQI